MNRPAHITDLHVERGRDIKRIVEYDIRMRGLTFDESVAKLGEALGVSIESLELAIAIANEWA